MRDRPGAFLRTAIESLPPALRLLLTHLRATLGESRSSLLPTPPVEWEPWLELVRVHYVGAYLCQRLPADVRSTLPEPMQVALRSLARNNAERSLVRSSELRRLTELFALNGVHVISFKGPLLAQRLYGNVGERHAGDLDLLVSAEQIERADRLLRAEGYVNTWPGFELTPRQQLTFLRLEHEFAYRHPERRVRVELQWRIDGLDALTWDSVWDRRESATFSGQSLAILPELDGLIYLFVHGSRHAWTRLFWLLDIAMLLAVQPALDWGALLSRAGELGVMRPMLHGLLLAHELLGSVLPDGASDRIEGHRQIVRLAEDALTQIARRHGQASTTRDLVQETSYLLRLFPDWKARRTVLLRRLSSPSNWQELRLPDRLFAGYYLAAPLLFVKRRWAGRRKQSSSG